MIIFKIMVIYFLSLWKQIIAFNNTFSNNVVNYKFNLLNYNSIIIIKKSFKKDIIIIKEFTIRRTLKISIVVNKLAMLLLNFNNDYWMIIFE